MYIGFLKCPLFFSDFNDNLIFVTIQNFMKTLHWEPRCFMLTDRQTDRTELVVAFRNFSNVPKNTCLIFTTGKRSALTRIAVLSVQGMREGR